MAEQDLREKLRGDIEVAEATHLLPHHRRDALLILLEELDILDVAVAIAEDQSEQVGALLAEKKLYKPSLAQLADWCVDLELRFQYVILQPYVLAQVVGSPDSRLS
jgi:hypothetical protein